MRVESETHSPQATDAPCKAERALVAAVNLEEVDPVRQRAVGLDGAEQDGANKLPRQAGRQRRPGRGISQKLSRAQGKVAVPLLAQARSAERRCDGGWPGPGRDEVGRGRWVGRLSMPSTGKRGWRLVLRSAGTLAGDRSRHGKLPTLGGMSG
jgi:hypothetical protein